MNVNQKMINFYYTMEEFMNKNPKGQYIFSIIKETINIVSKEHYLLLWVFFVSLYLVQFFTDSQIYSILEDHRKSVMKLKDDNQRLKATLEKMLQDEEAKQENIFHKELKKVKEDLNRDYEKRYELTIASIKALDKKLSTQKARVTILKKKLQNKIEELEDNLSIVDLREDLDEEDDEDVDEEE